MDNFKCIDSIPLCIGCSEQIQYMAFDGCHYYFIVSGACKIIQTDSCFKVVKCYKTSRNFDCICYDYKSCCFWAASSKCFGRIFKLNCDLNEIDCIHLSRYYDMIACITGISYDCCRDALLLSSNGCVFEFSKSCEKLCLKYKCPNIWVTGVLSLCPNYVITGIKCNKQFICVLDSNNNVLYARCLDCNYCVRNIIFNPCHKDCNDYQFDILAVRKGCYPYIIKVKVCNLGFTLASCNYKICHRYCKKECNTDASIVGSIARVETALSNILDSEGQKLQKVIATTNNIDKILCVNQEVNQALVNATHLEHVLYNKLVAATDNECCEDSCCHHEDCPPHSNCRIDGGTF